MTRLLATFNDFLKGDLGRLDKSSIPSGAFQGENVQLFQNGSVGPRSGIVDLANVDNPAGVPAEGLFYLDTAGVSTEYVVLHKGLNLYRIPVYDSSGRVLTGQSFATAAGAFAATGPSDYVTLDPRIAFVTIQGDKTYKYDATVGANGTITALAGSPGGFAMAEYRDVLVVANQGVKNRLQWSGRYNYSSWPAGNFLDVTGGGHAAPSITALKVLRDQLLIFTDMGQLFILTGTLGSSEVVRQFFPGDETSGPVDPAAVARTRDGQVIFTRRDMRLDTANGVLPRHACVPVTFTGAARAESPQQGDYLRDGPSNIRVSSVWAFGGRSEKHALLVERDSLGTAVIGSGFTFRAMILKNGAWTRHQLPDFFYARPCAGERGEIFYWDAATNRLKVWAWEYDAPPLHLRGSAQEYVPTTDLDSGVALVPAPYFQTPQMRAAQDENFVVERVVVEFTSHYNNAGAANNQLAAFVQMYDALTNAEVVDDTTPPVDHPFDKDDVAGAFAVGGVTVGTKSGGADVLTLAPGVAGADRRYRRDFFPTDQRPGPAFRVLLNNLTGVSIHEVLVYGRTQPTPRP